MTVLYPWGYLKTTVTLERLKELAKFNLMEPEYAERLEAWLISRGGHVGIGGAHRTTQPVGPTFAPGTKSFHLTQTFGDGRTGFMAVDLVCLNGDDVHRSPTWAEVPKQGSGHSDITNYGLHCNVGGEPWHMQAIEVDGFDGWVSRGRPHPNPDFPILKPAPPVQEGPFNPGERTLQVTNPLMQGIDIAYLQQTLARQGLNLDDDGIYGEVTAAAVRQAQEWNGLTQDGVVGPQTWAVIISYNAPPPPPPTPPPDPNYIEPGSRVLRLASPTMYGSDVIWVQNVLRNQGLAISTDGYYGRQTVDRVKQMQGWNNLTQDGVCGPQTFEVLKRY